MAPTRQAKAKEASIQQPSPLSNRSVISRPRPPKSCAQRRCVSPRRSCTKRREVSGMGTSFNTEATERAAEDRVSVGISPSPVLHAEQSELCGNDGVYQRLAARGHHRVRVCGTHPHRRGRRSDARGRGDGRRGLGGTSTRTRTYARTSACTCTCTRTNARTAYRVVVIVLLIVRRRDPKRRPAAKPQRTLSASSSDDASTSRSRGGRRRSAAVRGERMPIDGPSLRSSSSPLGAHSHHIVYFIVFLVFRSPGSTRTTHALCPRFVFSDSLCI